MRKRYNVIYKLLFLITILLIVTSCGKEKGNGELTDKEEVSIYFVNQLDGKLVAEKMFLSPTQDDTNVEKVQKTIEALQAGPQTASLLPVIPSEVAIEKAEIKEDSVLVYLSKEYKDIPVQKQMVMRASFVRTLTNLPFISSVEFLVESEPLLSPEGEPIGPIYKDDIVLVQPDPKPTTNVQNIVLYFGDSQGLGLIAENRKIQVNNNVPLERYIVEELIKGPQNDNNFRTVPIETKINDIKTKDGVCQIDLSAEFKSKHQGGSTGELYTIYSIVNSLTESSPKVKKVVFLIDGKKQTEFKGHLDLSILFERDEALIVKEEEEEPIY